MLALAGLSGASTAAVTAIVLALYLIAVSIVFATLGAIFRTGAYSHATTGKAPSVLHAHLLQASFRKTHGSFATATSTPRRGP